METKEKKRIHIYPLRLAVLLLSGLWLGFYFLRREDRELMNRLCETLVRPWHRLAGRFYDALPFSAASVYITVGVLLALAFVVWLVVILVQRRRRGQRLWCWAVTLVSLLSALFGLFCLWWGVYYYADSFREQSALESPVVTVEELETVTDYFVALVNREALRVERDGAGRYAGDLEAIFDKSPSLYREAVELFPSLEGPELRSKPFAYSGILSYLNTTGFFFPYTAEANLNVEQPLILIPATIAHEQAHQRGVAAEDEANFVGILACLANGDADYAYSAAIMGYIYLGNALHRADYDAWLEAYRGICEEARLDLTEYNAYWAQYETPVKEVSEAVYEVFLETYGDERGMESYGACVDLLVAYYYDEALAAANGAGG